MMADALTGYLLFYMVGQLFYALVYERLLEQVIFAFSVVAFLCSRRPAFAVIAHAGFVVRWCWMSPFMFNSDIWATIMDVGVIVATITFTGVRGLTVPMTSATERDALCREIMAILRNDLMWFYIGAGVWKMNWGFLDTAGSCAPIYILQLLDAYLPSALLPPPWVIQLVNDTAPALVIAVETGVGLLMHHPGTSRLIGVALGVCLHGLIAITPGPNNAGGFGVMLLVRYYAFVPEAMARTFDELSHAVTHRKATLRLLGLASLVLALSLPGYLRSADHVFFIDWSIPIYVVQAMLFARALAIEYETLHGARHRGSARSAPSDRRRIGDARLADRGMQRAVRLGCACWMVVYTFGLPMLGLQDMGNVHMFASLRMHGGSNHLFLPTGLLQQWLHDAHASSPWAGGVVRVDYASSAHMADLYPGEVTHILTPNVRELLRRSGHSGRQWFPLKSRIFGPAPHPSDLVGPRLPYTIPALELRRLLQEARGRGDTGYSLVYTRLPKGPLDVPSSRASHGESTISLTVDAHGGERCTVSVPGPAAWLGSLLGIGTRPCAPTELPNLPEVGMWPLKFLLFYPVPLLPETAGASSEMPCVDP